MFRDIGLETDGKNNNKEVIKMPRGDGTGPMGMGPMTGRAAGYCAGYGVPGYANSFRGLGAGYGGGRGRRNWFYATGIPAWSFSGAPYRAPYAPTRDQEMEALKNQAEHLEGALGDIRKRLQELEGEKR